MDKSVMIHLFILLPTEIFLDTLVSKVVAETDHGTWCLLPHHRDFVAPLVPGLLSYTIDAQETFVAVDEGILVKCAQEVRVSTRQAVHGPDLGQLRQTIEQQFRHLDAREALARAALARLEADTVRHFVRLGATSP